MTGRTPVLLLLCVVAATATGGEARATLSNEITFVVSTTTDNVQDVDASHAERCERVQRAAVPVAAMMKGQS